ncbi:putative F-box domain-containing protein [Medicago truncatula]|uniref:F-box protein interaction domain protein n=1 Tax=Medicago truncatula TaxID=3880 RepID=G7K4V6_MEDTR|nr:F-box protein interaction domain protein [Medicago truncatula]RHN58082.1 putative F-box domain-containing protein [Medicago truncatula]
MVISPTATTVQVSSSYLPEDIVFSILSKLPVKSLRRFECVSKSWSLLFDDNYFMNMYRNYFLSKDSSSSLLLHVEGGDYKYGEYPPYNLYSVSGERFEKRVKLDWPNPFVKTRGDPSPYGTVLSSKLLSCASVNGTLCIHSSYGGNVMFIIWNPTTDEFKVIPSSFEFPEFYWRPYTTHHLFGFDRVKKDYKFVQYVREVPHDQETEDDNFFWEIYSLNSNSWKKLKVGIPHSYRIDEQVYMDGVSHWLGESRTRTYLVSFDFSSESCIKLPIPSYINDNRKVERHLVILNGFIAFILAYKETSIFHISILGEIGIKESWTKLFIVGPLPFQLEYPIGAGEKGKILFRRKNDKLALFDLRTGMIDEIGTASKKKFGCNILFHKESILPIGGIYV